MAGVDAVTGEVEVQLVRASETVTIKHPFQWRPDGTCRGLAISVPLCFSSRVGTVTSRRCASHPRSREQTSLTAHCGWVRPNLSAIFGSEPVPPVPQSHRYLPVGRTEVTRTYGVPAQDGRIMTVRMAATGD